MRTLAERIQRRPWLGWLMFGGTLAGVFLAGMFTYTIVERRTEAKFAYLAPQTGIDPLEPRPEVWGRSFPRQFNTYGQMADSTFRSKHLGSQRRDLLEENPRLVLLFAGYAFSRDYNLSRGHIHSVDDVRRSLRTGAPMEKGDGPMPATCWTCKSPDVARLMHDLGPDAFYKGRLSDFGHEVVNPISCASCHDPDTMNLRITLPALAETCQRQGRDITRSSHQQMRSLACAQCHVEYYFGRDNRLVYPWDKGMRAEDMAAYYDEIGFSDWTHPLSRAPMIKAQHPDYEVFTTGIHYQRGVACADCHMPYATEGGQKFTDHRVQSPLNNIANACQTCHRQSEAELTRNVHERQDMIKGLRSTLEAVLVTTHLEAEYAWKLGATEAQMAEALHLIRHAQWRWDYAAATHGGSFHAPLELARTIGDGLDLAHQARRAITAVLVALGHPGPVPLPDVSTKAAAQAYLGIDLEALKAGKQGFLDKVVPAWLAQARERHQRWDANKADPARTGSYLRD